ncbi:biotin--[acetyl-CoA-carboxylase] ligase [Persicitalea jodogahamensis]|uniref:Biotin--[acetyl-CoA-carboxylase] ligase n=1 Tax=Persicitalea jodogahamensis TaxID=402147 RepID=A0A8J3D5K8_9BACT|nr:biotin--[acetyl-CoA-carboxylase] ligase [Persicitalea jodogahamensis]GHB56420.1 biotin--[acetyl-CoA-carboxylase] ligase [Persicitalea jodogahamensis]
MYLPTCHSTNDIATELVRNGKLADGAVIITDEQTGGRGQHGTSWLTSRGQNFTLSVVLMPTFLSLSEHFLLSQSIALGIRNYLADFVSNIWIKWPNDLYINDLKVGGVLIENALQGTRIAHSVVGIGLNINQADFSSVPSGRVTSLRLETGMTFHLAEQLPRLLLELEKVYLRLRAGRSESVRIEYRQHLLGLGQKRVYSIGGQLVEGTIMGVSLTGKLRLELANGEICEFDIKEIKWQWAD